MFFFYKFHMRMPVMMALRLAAGRRGLPAAAVRALPAPVGRAARPGHGGGRRRHVRRGAGAAAPLAPLACHSAFLSLSAKVPGAQTGRLSALQSTFATFGINEYTKVLLKDRILCAFSHVLVLTACIDRCL